jgi:hypothetical protein
MKARPIIFSSQMVQSILDGRKTQTRRVIKPQPEVSAEGYLMGEWLKKPLAGLLLPKLQDITIHCPFGKIGDRLWVRETWQGPIIDDDEFEACRQNAQKIFLKPDYCVYRATDKLDAVDIDGNELGWRTSTSMPRWASRITLEITDIRVEKLQDISEEDAISEGLPYAQGNKSTGCMWDGVGYHGAGFDRYENKTYHTPKNGKCGCIVGGDTPAQCAYRELWESINGKGSWGVNPWVWVVEFRRI